MNGPTSGYDDPSTVRPTDDRRTEPGRGPVPRPIVVRYEDRPDRCTIVPASCSGHEQLTTWLSADLDAFVDLETVR